MTFDWQEFLFKLNDKLLSSNVLRSHIKRHPNLYSSEVLESGWLGYPSANEEQILKAEEKLGITLPNTYKDFLRVSNGWRGVSTFIPQICPIEETDWFSKRNPDEISSLSTIDDYIISDEEYLIYNKPNELQTRWYYLFTNLQISNRELSDTATYMLNPKIITTDGEWEAWFYAHWLHGASRYQSFKDLMIAEYNNID